MGHKSQTFRKMGTEREKKTFSASGRAGKNLQEDPFNGYPLYIAMASSTDKAKYFFEKSYIL